MALIQNATVTVLKLGYNALGDEGVRVLSLGIGDHTSIESLDLGFNNFGDIGCKALADCIPSDGRAWTLYLAGNLIGEDGAMALADMIRRRCSIRRLYLTGNRLGPNGVKAITDAILEDELCRRPDNKNVNKISKSDNDGATGNDSNSSNCTDCFAGMQELFLGGTRMGTVGCEAVSKLVSKTCYLRTLSLSNCDIGDSSIAMLAKDLKANRDHIPLESLELSFNRITSQGMEHLADAIWGSRTLRELMLDNNEIGDSGAQQIAAVLPFLTSLESLNIGFNRIKSAGMKLLMKAVADSQHLQSLCVSGNAVDTASAKFIAFALAHNSSLLSLSLDHCSIANEGQRHIVAGIVSNSQTSLREIRGFNVGPIIVTLGFPPVMEHWNNEHVMNFIHLMWERSNSNPADTEEKVMDPLHFLSTDDGAPPQLPPRVAPLEADAVVEIAKKTFASLVQEGVDVFSRRPGYNQEALVVTPPLTYDDMLPQSSADESDESSMDALTAKRNRSFVAPPEEAPKSSVPDPSRKKRIVEWLCSNIQHLNKLAQKPFSSAELWQLHQHYFTPVVNESGGSVAPSPNPSFEPLAPNISSVPEVSRTSSSEQHGDGFDESVEDSLNVPASDPSMRVSPNGLHPLPMLKRKVSYRFLADAADPPSQKLDVRNAHSAGALSVSMMIEGGPAGHSLPPKTKRARRNRTRISFLPRVKGKLDSFLDVCHEKALVTMRQLYYVEQAILRGEVNPIDPKTTSRTHLCGDFATDAEMIVVDMI